MIKVLVGLVSPESSFLGLQITTFLLCTHLAFCLYTCIPSVSTASSSFFKKYLFIFGYARSLSVHGLSLVVDKHGLLIAATSLIVKHGL